MGQVVASETRDSNTIFTIDKNYDDSTGKSTYNITCKDISTGSATPIEELSGTYKTMSAAKRAVENYIHGIY